MKILLSAYACEPLRSSEPSVGWNWAKQIARFHEVWVITRENNRAIIEREVAREPIPNVHWIFYDVPRAISFWKKGARGLLLYYYLWQAGIYRMARQLHKLIGFDLIHHSTFVQYWTPSYLAMLGVPFIWGPVGGAEETPGNFFAALSCRGQFAEGRRAVVQRLCRRDPFVRMTAKRSALALAATPDTAKLLLTLGARRVAMLPAFGVDRDDLDRMRLIDTRREGVFRLISIGRLLPWKGFNLGLQAFQRLSLEIPDAEYWIAGDGPERRYLERSAHKLGVMRKVKFLGDLSRDDVLGALGACDILVHPSLHDSGGMVCNEAMAAGRPVICLDRGGPALQVTEETGVKVSASSPGAAVSLMADAMLWFARHPERRLAMDALLRSHAAAYDWNEKGEVMAKFYRSAVNDTKPSEWLACPGKD
jgi:glycosyltransferase involved in cell wall biosynthesis